MGNEEFIVLKCECPHEACHLAVRLRLIEVVEFHRKDCLLIIDGCANTPDSEDALVEQKHGYAWYSESRVS